MSIELRDYFAAKALPLAMANYRMVVNSTDEALGSDWNKGCGLSFVAADAYELADAMIEAKNRTIKKESILIEKLWMTGKLDLSVRTLNGLKMVDIDTIEELCRMSEVQLSRRVPNVGKKAAREIAEAIEKLGYKLKESE